MTVFVEVMNTENYSLLGKGCTQKDWLVLYDAFWKAKNDSFSNFLFKQQQDLLIKETKLSIIITVYNSLLSIAVIPQSKKVFQQKMQLIDLYKKQTGNEVSYFDSYTDLLSKIKASVQNFENIVDKARKELKSDEKAEVSNGFDLVASVSVSLGISLNIKEITVAEYLAYVKIAKKQRQKNE